MFDTHCHLNFSAFKKNLEDVISSARNSGIDYIVVPGTDLKSSQKGIEIAEAHEHIFAAVGIHPHHVYESKVENPADAKAMASKPNFEGEDIIGEIERLLQHKKVVAVGEVGVDRYVYTQTKYKEYTVDETFVEEQKKLLAKQIQLAIIYNKSLIIHNRIAKKDLFEVLATAWDRKLEGRTVLHCCEPDEELFSYAKEHSMFLGIDGDITYSKEKQAFIKKIGAKEFLSRYVLETDAPFLLPEPLRTQKKYPNKPENIVLIAQFIADLLSIPVEQIVRSTTSNAASMFRLS